MALSGIEELHTVFLLLLTLVVCFALLAERVKIPYPIVLVVAGLVLALFPRMPRVVLDPALIFVIVLPPLLFGAAWTTSWREFRLNLVSICLLAFGLAAFTVWGVARVAPGVFAGFDWELGIVLGAAVATTDAIAATSIAKRIGLPRRIVDVLEGESLINDASGLLALEFAIGLLVSHRVPSAAEGALRLAWLTLGGIGVGLAVGWLVDLVERRIEDAQIEVVLSLMVSYVTYLAAEKIHASGVLAVVACGLLLSRRSAFFFSPQVRLQVSAVWSSFIFALNGLVFVLIGLQLPTVRAAIRGYSLSTLILDGALLSALLILLRLLWVFPGAYAAYFIRTRLLHQRYPRPPFREVFVVGWTGMRGVVALAAALSLPATLANGQPLPYRNLIIFLTFSVIFVTLVLQGLTLPWIIRLLRLQSTSGSSSEESEVRQASLAAALAHLVQLRSEAAQELWPIYDDLEEHYRRRLAEFDSRDGRAHAAAFLAQHRQLSKELLDVERRTAVEWRDQGRISDDVLRKMEYELDLGQAQLSLPADI